MRFNGKGESIGVADRRGGDGGGMNIAMTVQICYELHMRSIGIRVGGGGEGGKAPQPPAAGLAQARQAQQAQPLTQGGITGQDRAGLGLS
ncbi:hypothetical protein VTL71DRAFT_11507 [Oculimacula yallundae]|uniref:Uncharacterized protein n=1 Tax=Oculimacula yallundae TaxID=86028 RepID=A0ABR4CQR3_9HELO